MLKKVGSFEEIQEMVGTPVFGRYQNDDDRWYLVYGSNSDKLKETIVSLLDADGFLHDIREDHFQFWRLKYVKEAQN